MAWFNAGLSSNSGGASSFNELDDVSINTQTLSNGQVPVYNSTTHKWENGEQSVGASSFNELDDVSINAQTLSNGQVPVYNSTTHKWENGEQSGGSSGHTIIDDGGTSLTQRDNLQFKGAYSEDNSTNEKTVVNVVREMTKAQFDQLTNNEKTGFINITDITGGNDDRFQPVIYSEDEREIGVWIDGKPLYEKTINVGALPNQETKTVNHNISDIEAIYGIEGIAYSSSTNTSINLPYANTYNINVVVISANRTLITINTYRDRTSFNGYVTLQYTKTTDTAGSGQWTPQGVPAHHYSTDEQVVGTWIDGSTLYEKTFVFSNGLVCDAYTWTVTTIDVNFNKVIQSEGTSDGTANVSVIATKTSDGKLQIMNLRNATLTVGSVTVRYTKSV